MVFKKCVAVNLPWQGPFFRDIKRSSCLIFLTMSMSLGRRSGCSKASAIWAEWHLWNSLTKAFQGMVTPSTSSRGDQVRCWRCTSVPISSSWLSIEVDLLSLRSLAVFYCLVPFWGAISPSSSSYIGLFFFRFGIACSSRSVRSKGRKGRRMGGTWDLGTSFEVDPLFLAAMRSLRPLFPQFNAISSSSSSEVLSRLGVAKSDTTREPDTANPFINRSWVKAKRVQVKFGLTRLTHLLNGSYSCSTCWTRLTRLAYKGNFTILPLKPRYISLVMIYSPQN